MKSSTDVIIVGGGIIGTMLAYQLAESGRSVRLLEQGLVGQEASGAYAGLLTTNADGKGEGAYLSLSKQALTVTREVVARLEAETGLDVELVRMPLLRVALNEQERSELYLRWRELQQRGENVAWLEPGELRIEAPELSPRVTGAIRSAEEYHLAPSRLLRATLVAAQRYGAQLHQQTAAHRLITTDNRVIGVEAGGTAYHAEHTILANGAWSPLLLQPLKLYLAVSPQKGQMLRLLCHKLAFPYMVNTFQGYIVPKSEDAVIVGATRENAGFNKETTVAGLTHLLLVQSVLPVLLQSTLHSIFVGLRPASEDGMPLLGPIPGWQGLYAATGHSQHGILLAAITAIMFTRYLNEEKPDILWPAFQVARAIRPLKDEAA